MRNHAGSRRSGLFLFLAALTTSVPAVAAALVWKPIQTAVLKMDDRPVKLWELYRTDKKESLLLLQLGARFLLLDVSARQVFEIPEKSLSRREKVIHMRFPDHAGVVLSTAEWTFRDLGRARLIRLRLAEEGRWLEIQLPQTPRHRNFY